MESSVTMQFVLMRVQAEMAASHGAELCAEHIFLGIMKLAELSVGDITSKETRYVQIE